MRDYKELLGLVSRMEMIAPKPTVNYVGMELATGEPLFVGTPRKFPELLGTITSVETGAQPSQPKQKAAKPQPQAKPAKAGAVARVAPEAPTSEILPEPPSWTTVPEIVATQEAEPKPRFGVKLPKRKPAKVPPSEVGEWKNEPAPQQAKNTKSLEQTAAEELAKTVKSADITPPQQAVEARAPAEGGLVLPTLSLIDQVSELDKIIDNVKNGRFDNYQMEIVREEVEGLSKAVSALPKESEPSNPIEQDMLKLRRSRLSEALALIG